MRATHGLKEINRHRITFFLVLFVLTSVLTAAASGARKVPAPAEDPNPPGNDGYQQPGVDLRSAGDRLLAGPVVNTSVRHGNQTESTIGVNPTNPNNIVAFSNEGSASAIFRAYSFDGGLTWTSGDILSGACCDGQCVFDRFGNLFLVYIPGSVNSINVVMSTDGGVTFSAPVIVGTGSIDQPSIAAGNGSLWVDWNLNGSMVVRGAPVTGLGQLGAFGAVESAPGVAGTFGGIAVGPGPNGGKVIITYQDGSGGQGPSNIWVNVDPDGLGPAGFGAQVKATVTNVGGFDYIPAQSGRSIDAEAGLVWDATGGPNNNKIYLVYTDETVNENNDTDIRVRTSTDDGQTWSNWVRVNDDPGPPIIRSQFLPYIALDPTTGIVAISWHDCRNDNGVPGVGGTNTIPNDDAEYFASYSTDGGATWAANVQLSGGFSNAADAHNGIDYGDFVGNTAYGGFLHPVWADNSNSTGDNPDGTLHQFDLYTAPLNINDISAGVDSPNPVRPQPVSIFGHASLQAPAPNPALDEIRLSYGLPSDQHVVLSVHDVSGREVIRLVDGQRPAGPHSITWDRRDNYGSRMAAGVYFVRMLAGGESLGHQTIVLR